MWEVVDLSLVDGFQVVKIPVDMSIKDTKVYMRHLEGSLILLPFHNPWGSFFSTLDDFSDDFMAEREQPAIQEREGL